VLADREGSAVGQHERKRLYHEATDFLRLRAERLKWVQQGGDAPKTMVAVAEAHRPAATINSKE